MQEETVAYHVNTAKVILADYALLRRDFPTLLKDLSDAQIDQWLLQNTALIAKSQYEKGEATGVNTYIDADISQQTPAFRPIDYGRATIIQVGHNGNEDLLIDVKGVGARFPSWDSGHSSGLAYLTEMIYEYAFEKLVHQIFVHSQSGLDTIETYAVLDLGFKGTRDTRVGGVDAALVLRQAHKRYMSPDEFGMHYYQLEESSALKVEKVLRKYGVSSVGFRYFERMGESYRCHDIQGSEEGAIVDFGPFLASETFDASLATARAVNWSGGCRILLDQHSPDFIQPDKNLRVAMETWGIQFDSYRGQWINKPYTWIPQWVQWIQNGQKSKEDFKVFLDGLYQVEQDRWKSYDSLQSIQN